jgi:purine-binding chemotaxis protein CheW
MKIAQRILVSDFRMSTKDAPDSEFELDFSSLLDFPVAEEADFPIEKAAVPVQEAEKYVVFHLDDKMYGVNSKQVMEVIGFLPVTSLPLVPEWLAGIANLRGNIISVVDLRKLWKKTIPETAPPHKTKLLVLRSEKDSHPIAFVVDKLNEIVAVNAPDIEFSAADFASAFPTFFGKITHKSQTLYLLDAENLFSSISRVTAE